LTPDGTKLGYVTALYGANSTAGNINTTITSGQLRLCVFAGCETATNDGPHTATVRIRVAAVPVVPA
jgi:hypothetical protein